MWRMTVLGLITILHFSVVLADDAEARRKQQAAFARMQKLAQPGDEHAQLKQLAGTWDVTLKHNGKKTNFVGTAESEMILGDRFLVIDGRGRSGNRRSEFRYTIGFDRRHGEYVINAMDNSGTYPVSARGKPTDMGIRMFGTDDDPYMKQLGYEKKFAFDLDVDSEDQFSLATLWVDTRTKEEKLLPAIEYTFLRRPAKE